MTTVSFHYLDVIFKEDDLGRNMFKVLDGLVGIYAHYGKPEEKKLTELKPGDYLGEMAVIEAYPRSATAVALAEGTQLVEIEGSRLLDYLSEGDEELYGIFRHLSRRLRELSDDYTELCETLREIGRLDTSGEKVNEGLLNKLKKFAAVYLLNQNLADWTSAEAEREQRHEADGEAVRSETYRKGTVIFRAGEVGKYLYDLRSGRVGIYSRYGEAAQKQLAVLEPGDYFGEMGLLEKLPRSATAVAMDDDTCVELFCEEDLHKLIQTNPAKVMGLLRHLSNRLRRLTTDYLKACKVLEEAQKQIRDANNMMPPAAQAHVAYITQMMLMPEQMF
ncbi:MAG: cyclic nucleotide-binding domain-containing protein [Ruminococcaceae bacterium]|jgi:CRP-like cAMP-binding protein|nr:cyclic nucleotide-binding domain-containing protein [Oscillospiraceae bacterium]